MCSFSFSNGDANQPSGVEGRPATYSHNMMALFLVIFSCIYFCFDQIHPNVICLSVFWQLTLIRIEHYYLCQSHTSLAAFFLNKKKQKNHGHEKNAGTCCQSINYVQFAEFALRHCDCGSKVVY